MLLFEILIQILVASVNQNFASRDIKKKGMYQ